MENEIMIFLIKFLFSLQSILQFYNFKDLYKINSILYKLLNKIISHFLDFIKVNENTYYVIEEMDEIDENNPIIVYIDDGVKKNIISTNFFTVSLDKNYREGYVLCKLSNKLKYYCDTTSFIEFFLNL